MAGAFFYCSKAGLQRRVVRVEGILDGSMYVGKPNHLYIQRNLNIKLFTAHVALQQQSTRPGTTNAQFE